MTRFLWNVADLPRLALARRRQGWSWLGALRSAWLCSTKATRRAWACLLVVVAGVGVLL